MNLSNLSSKTKQLLEKRNLTSPHSVLHASELDWRQLGLDEEEIDKIKSRAANEVFKGFSTVTENNSSDRWKKISFGCQNLDKLTEGGLPMRGITEIYGAAGSGKTQICLQLCHTAQLPENFGGLGKGVVYISTEGPFACKRFLQLSSAFKRRHKILKDTIDFENLFAVDYTEVKDVLNCIKVSIPKLTKYRPIGLIVIDSVGALFRSESTSIIERAQNMRMLVRELHQLHHENACAILCVNQVTSVMDSMIEVPSLGLAWSNLVTTRICVKRNDVEKPTRTMKIIFSSELPEDSADFIITENGVENAVIN